jgi:hypothetical protein
MWHPETGGLYEAPTDGAVAQARQSGWLLAAERAEHEARLAAHPSQNPDAAPADPDPGAAAKPKSKTEGSA